MLIYANVFLPECTVKNFTLKWLCGVDYMAAKPPKLTKEQILENQQKMTDIHEDPYWKKVLDYNMIACVAFTVFLHAFWA